MRWFKRWGYVAFYILGIIVFTPYLPHVIRWATARWPGRSVSRFVLIIEIGLALLIFGSALWLIFRKRKKALFFFLAVAGLFLFSFLLYRFLPNPYEYTHLPEYAVLSFLLAKALGGKIGDGPSGPQVARKLRSWFIPQIRNLYWESGLITGFIGLGDEIYQYFLPKRFFTWYDIFLNILGGMVGLLVFWALKK